jgi:hypothetical protein
VSDVADEVDAAPAAVDADDGGPPTQAVDMVTFTESEPAPEAEPEPDAVPEPAVDADDPAEADAPESAQAPPAEPPRRLFGKRPRS